MGTPYHHYLIADPIVVPASHEIYYSEEILRIPCYQPNDRKRSVAERPPTRAEAGLPDDAFVFCSFNATQKLDAPHIRAVITILAQVPNSVLWMLKADDETMERLQRYARSAASPGSGSYWPRSWRTRTIWRDIRWRISSSTLSLTAPIRRQRIRCGWAFRCLR